MRRRILIFGAAAAVSNTLVATGAAVLGLWQTVAVATVADIVIFVVLARS